VDQNPSLPPPAYLQAQLTWSKPTRQYIYRKIALAKCKNILEIGCGYGHLLKELSQFSNLEIYGIDTSRIAVEQNICRCDNVHIQLADACHLPFQKNFFDAIICNYLFMWLQKPIIALKEAHRVLKPNGWFIFAGEPDFNGRIDYPDSFKWSTMISEKIYSLKGDPNVGSKLPYLFAESNFSLIEYGCASNVWYGKKLLESWQDEKQFVQWVIEDNPNFNLDKIETEELIIRKAQQRIIFSPTFWAIGRKKELM
jgi:SAM-dependent methyltransferase